MSTDKTLKEFSEKEHSNRFYVLVLKESNPRLYEGDKSTLKPVGADTIFPESVEAALAEATQEDNVQMRSGQSAFDTPIFYEGEGGGRERDRGRELGTEHQLKRLKRYFYHIDHGLTDIIGEERIPVVLAAPDYMVPIYKETSNYLDITPVHISGEFDTDELETLHKKAMEIVNNYFQNGQQQQLENA